MAMAICSPAVSLSFLSASTTAGCGGRGAPRPARPFPEALSSFCGVPEAAAVRGFMMVAMPMAPAWRSAAQRSAPEE
jgi:hypothetical protein